MSNELKEMLQSVIHEALQPINDRLDRLESRFEGLELRFEGLESRFEGLETKLNQFEAFTKNKFNAVDAKLDSILHQVASNTEHLVELQNRMVMTENFSYRLESLESRVNELTLDVQVLKKAVSK